MGPEQFEKASARRKEPIHRTSRYSCSRQSNMHCTERHREHALLLLQQRGNNQATGCKNVNRKLKRVDMSKSLRHLSQEMSHTSGTFTIHAVPIICCRDCTFHHMGHAHGSETQRRPLSTFRRDRGFQIRRSRSKRGHVARWKGSNSACTRASCKSPRHLALQKHEGEITALMLSKPETSRCARGLNKQCASNNFA